MNKHPGSNLNLFELFVENAANDNEAAEKLVRKMVSGMALVCPLPVLVKVAECLIVCHRQELLDLAAQN